jgi:hypothetical protein
LSQEQPLNLVSEIIGHSDVKIALSVCGHVLNELRKDTATAMEKILRGGF